MAGTLIGFREEDTQDGTTCLEYSNVLRLVFRYLGSWKGASMKRHRYPLFTNNRMYHLLTNPKYMQMSYF